MNARHAARELALLTLFQMESPEKALQAVEKASVQQLMINAVRSLSDHAQSAIQDAVDQWVLAHDYFRQMEDDDPANLNSGLYTPSQPVPIQTTRDTMAQLEQCLVAANHLAEAIRLPELIALSASQEVQHYMVQLIRLVAQHQSALDALINTHAEGWDLKRLIKMDRLILYLALAEMQYIPSVDHGVSIDEAVELAKDFSTEESFRFINGILGKVADSLASELSTPEQPLERLGGGV